MAYGGSEAPLAPTLADQTHHLPITLIEIIKQQLIVQDKVHSNATTSQDKGKEQCAVNEGSQSGPTERERTELPRVSYCEIKKILALAYCQSWVWATMC